MLGCGVRYFRPSYALCRAPLLVPLYIRPWLHWHSDWGWCVMKNNRLFIFLVLAILLVVIGAAFVIFTSSRATSAVNSAVTNSTSSPAPLHRGRGDDPANDVADAIIPPPPVGAPNSACLSTQERVDGRCVVKCGINEERVNGECVLKCLEDQERINSVCVPKCTANQERVHGVCVPKCGANEKRVNDACVPA